MNFWRRIGLPGRRGWPMPVYETRKADHEREHQQRLFRRRMMIYGVIAGFVFLLWIFAFFKETSEVRKSTGTVNPASTPAPVREAKGRSEQTLPASRKRKGDAPGSRAISRTDLTDWPLTVASGVLRCRKIMRAGRVMEAVTFEYGGNIYNVNGTASTLSLGQEIGPIWARGDPVLVRDPQTGKTVNAGPPKKNIGDLLNAGIDLCAQLP